MKPGWKTSEFWITVVTALPGLLVAAGLVPVSDQAMLDATASKLAAGVVAAVAISKYIGSRTAIKSATVGKLALVLVFALPASPAWGQTAAVRPTCFGYRQRPTDSQILQLLQQISQQQQQILALLQQQPAQPHYIVLSPAPALPLGGAPHQALPLGGMPRQEIPLGGPPRQDLPLGPPPRQEIPLGPAPRQDIPLGPPPARPQPTIAYQRYTLYPLFAKGRLP